MLGRNDLCHCGSGKKYKKCCMEKDLAEKATKVFEDKKNKIKEIYTSTVTKLNEKVDAMMSSNVDYRTREEECKKEFFAVYSNNDSLSNSMMESNSAANRFFASYFIYDYPIIDNVSFAELALKDGGFTQEEYNLIANLINSSPSLFDIAKMDDNYVVLKDAFTGKEYTTIDGDLLKDFTIGDTILGRPVLIGDSYLLIDLTIRILPAIREVIATSLLKEYEKLDSDRISLELFVSLNSLYFYRYMLYLLDTIDGEDKSDEGEGSIESESDSSTNEELDNASESSISNSVVEIDEDSAEGKVKKIIENTVDDKEELKEILSIVDSVYGKIEIKGREKGWSAAFDYYYRKSNKSGVTQADVAGIYNVSISTLAKRYKEISAAISK